MEDISNLPNQIKLEALYSFIDLADDVYFEKAFGGVNNFVWYVSYKDSNQNQQIRVLRVYNNGGFDKKVLFEHKVLNLLKNYTFSFQVPFPYPNLKNQSSFVKLSNGNQASLFKLIPGILPKLKFAKEIGQASGQISKALGEITQQMEINGDLRESVIPPYYDLYAVHHSISKQIFLDQVKQEQFDQVRESITYLVDQIQIIEQQLNQLLEKNMPKQLIHGDLHYDNILCDEKGVTGVLDFEFCTLDFRAMEIAICLSKYASENDSSQYFQDFIQGYAQTAILNSKEIKYVPNLIILRILSNVIYFVGRAVSGEDSIKQITSRADAYKKRIEYIIINSDYIRDQLLHEFIKNQNLVD